MEKVEIQKLNINKMEVVKETLFILLPISCLILVLTWVVYDVRVKSAESVLRHKQQVNLDLQKDELEKEIDSAVTDVLFLRRALDSYRNIWQQDASAKTDLEDFAHLMLNFSRSKGVYDQIRVINKQGMELIRVNYNGGAPAIVYDKDLQDKSNRYYFTDTLSIVDGSVYASPLDLNIENGQIEVPIKPVIRIGAPVSDMQGNKLGIVIVNYFGSVPLKRFRDLGRISSGTPLLINQNGYFLVGIEDEDEWGFMYPDRTEHTFATVFGKIWEQVKSSEYGQIEDSQGLFAFKAIYPFVHELTTSTDSTDVAEESLDRFAGDEYSWKAISFLPAEIYRAEANQLTRSLLFILPAILSSMGFIIYRLSFWRVYRRESEAQKKLLISDLQRALEEVKTLQGILPICMYCKQIRNDKEAWIKLESYFAENSDLQFSHGICPNCMDKHHGKYIQKMPKQDI